MEIYTQDIDETISQLRSSAQNGLSEPEVARRLAEYGNNEIKRTNKRNIIIVFAEQFKNMLVILLVVAAGISFFLDADRDATILVMVVFFNALIGFYQDW